jgi:hypothetical protein
MMMRSWIQRITIPFALSEVSPALAWQGVEQETVITMCALCLERYRRANASWTFMLRYLSTNVVGGLHDSRLPNATWYQLSPHSCPPSPRPPIPVSPYLRVSKQGG